MFYKHATTTAFNRFSMPKNAYDVYLYIYNILYNIGTSIIIKSYER